MTTQSPPRVPLIRAMKRRGITPNHLASLTGTHPSTISRLRSGRQSPNRVTAALIADALGCSTAELGLAPKEGGAA